MNMLHFYGCYQPHLPQFHKPSPFMSGAGMLEVQIQIKTNRPCGNSQRPPISYFNRQQSIGSPKPLAVQSKNCWYCNTMFQLPMVNPRPWYPLSRTINSHHWPVPALLQRSGHCHPTLWRPLRPPRAPRLPWRILKNKLDTCHVLHLDTPLTH